MRKTLLRMYVRRQVDAMQFLSDEIAKYSWIRRTSRRAACRVAKALFSVAQLKLRLDEPRLSSYGESARLF